jgi:predicted secreted protein
MNITQVGYCTGPPSVRILAAMKRILSFVFALAVLALGAGTATAATADDIRIIGFSKDGRHFAYETFGTSDGSGAPYASIVIIDLVNDKWVGGSPFTSSFGEEEHPTALPAQMQVRKKAAPALAKLDLRYPYRLVGFAPVGQDVADPLELKFKLHHNISDLWTVKLEEVDLEGTGRCKDYPDQMKGVAISIAGGVQPELQEVYRDTRLPASRGCVIGYRIAGVVQPAVRDTGLSVVLIHTLTRGFEGLDASFMAVPVRLPSWR